MAASSDCRHCIHGRKNTGRIVPVEQVGVFCLRLDAIRDKAVVDVLEPLLRQAATTGQCPHFDGGQDLPDSYRADDL